MKRLIKASVSKSDWQNYGDADPFERGRLVRSDGADGFDILYIEPVYDTDGLYECAWCYVDADDVIDWMTYNIDTTMSDSDSISEAKAEFNRDPYGSVVYYIDEYGPYECQPRWVGSDTDNRAHTPLATHEEVQEALRSIGF